LEELTNLLEARILRASSGASIKLADLVDAIRELRQQQEQTLPRLISRAKLSRADAQRRTEMVKRAHRIFSIINSDASRAIEVLKSELTEASKRPQKVYLPGPSHRRHSHPQIIAESISLKRAFGTRDVGPSSRPPRSSPHKLALPFAHSAAMFALNFAKPTGICK
jgi:cobalamin-dependent methionine synthase I